MRKSKKVLFVCYYFPPIGGVGAIRAVKFIKYLPEFGFTPVVLTHNSKNDLYIDKSLFEELPKGIKIYRSEIKKTLHERFGHQRKNNHPALKPDILHREKKSIFTGLREFIAGHLYIPDDKVRWVGPAVKEALDIIRKENIDIIVTCGAPFSVHLIGKILKDMTKKIWVADFRDPWIGHAHLKYPSFISKMIQKKMEKEVIKKASLVVSATEPITLNFQKRYIGLPSKKFITITNGFDPADFKGIKEKKGLKSGKIHIVFSGSVYSATDLSVFFLGLKNCYERIKDLDKLLEVIILGYIDSNNLARIKELKLSNLVKLIAWKEHRESLKVLKNADILLLSFRKSSNSNVIFTGKIFDYLASKKPVLAIIPEGILKDLIVKLKAGSVIDSNDVNGVSDFLKKLVEKKIPLKIKYKDSDIKEFDRKVLTKKLAQALEDLL